MAKRSVALMTTLLELHRVQEPDALLPTLLQGMAPEYGRAVAAAYLTGETGDDLYLHLLADTDGRVTADQWQRDLRLPVSLPPATAAPVLARLVAADPVSLTGPLGSLLDGLWPPDTSAHVQRALRLRFAAVAPVRMASGPAGLLLLLLQERWPVTVAGECAAHTSAALARLLEQRRAAQAGAMPFARGMIDQAAAREISRAQRYGRTLSIVVLDQDASADTAASQHTLARLAVQTMRQPDTAGLLEPGRVVVLLPETGPAGADRFLRRLEAAAGAGLPGLGGGYATFPDDGDSYVALVAAATARLEPLAGIEDGSPREAGAGIVGALDGAASSFGGRAAATVTVRVRVAPLVEDEADRWQSLLQRLPTVIGVERCGFDGFAATFDVQAPAVTRLLTELQRVTRKMGADLTPTITGEVGLTMRPPSTRPRGRLGGLREGSMAGVTVEEAAEGGIPPLPLPRPRSVRTPARRLRRSIFAGIGAAALAAAVLAGVANLAGSDTGGPMVSDSAPAAATTPTATAAQTQAGLPAVRRIERDLDGRCLPEPGQSECDALRAGLWAGDLDTWRQWAALQGERPPSPADVLLRTMTMRLAAGDPASRADFARRAGKPLPLITALDVRSEDGGQRVLALEFANLGGAAADLAGVMLPGTFGRVQPGARLAVGERCVLGPAAGERVCPFGVTGWETFTIAAGEHIRLVAADGQQLDDYVIR